MLFSLFRCKRKKRKRSSFDRSKSRKERRKKKRISALEIAFLSSVCEKKRDTHLKAKRIAATKTSEQASTTFFYFVFASVCNSDSLFVVFLFSLVCDSRFMSLFSVFSFFSLHFVFFSLRERRKETQKS